MVATGRRAGALVLASAALAATGGCGGEESERLVVFAASSLAEVLPAIDPDARYSFASSRTLARQIEEGAPADVYLSASPEHTRALAELGLIDTPVPVAANELVVALPPGNPGRIERVGDLAGEDVELLLAGPDVPVGEYARQALVALGLEQALDRLVSEEADAAAVVAKLALGEGDAAVVYRTDLSLVDPELESIPLPASAQPRILYEAAAVSASSRLEAAREFVRRLRSQQGRAILLRAGFLAP